MAINFLEALRRGSPMLGGIASTPAPFNSSSPIAPNGGMPANVLEAIGGSPNAAPAPQASPAEPPRKRRSFLDTIGQISDVIARVGGAEALYQPTLDAREDRARQIDMDGLRRQLAEQQITQGGQTIKAGDEELADNARARLGRAIGAIATNPDAVAMWPQIAAQADIDEQQAAQIWQLLQSNPKLAPALAQSLGWSPTAKGSGSQAKELQIYQMLQEEGTPEMAKAYLQSLTNPDSMTDYQKAQLAISLQELQLRQADTEFNQGIKSEELDLKRDKGSADLTPTQRGQIKQKLGLLPVARQQYQRVRELYNEMLQDGTLARGPLGGLLPGQIAGGKAEEFDKAVGALRKSILAMTRVPGIGSMSNYETMLDEAAIPSRWGSDEGRAEAINNIGQLLDGYESGYKDMLGSPAPSRSAPSRPAPRGAPAAPTVRRSVSPAAAEARRRGLIK